MCECFACIHLRCRPGWAAQEHAATAVGGHRDVAQPHPLRSRVRRPQVGSREDRAEHDPHLVLGKGGADAAPYTAAEGNPVEATALSLQEPLGPELEWVGVDVLAVV